MRSALKQSSFIAFACTCSLTVAAVSPVKAATSKFDFRTPTTTTTFTREFPSDTGNIKLTVNNAQGLNQPIAASIATSGDGQGGVNTDINNGLCVSYRVGPSNPGARCQYQEVTDSSLTGLTLSFDRAVNLKSFDILRPGSVTKGKLLFTSGSLSQLLEFDNPGGGEQDNGIVFTTLSFPSIFSVGENAPIVLDTSSTEFLAGQSYSFRINNFIVEETSGPLPVPGPLPAMGVSVAFVFSRRLRKRIKTS